MMTQLGASRTHRLTASSQPLPAPLGWPYAAPRKAMHVYTPSQHAGKRRVPSPPQASRRGQKKAQLPAAATAAEATAENIKQSDAQNDAEVSELTQPSSSSPLERDSSESADSSNGSRWEETAEPSSMWENPEPTNGDRGRTNGTSSPLETAAGSPSTIAPAHSTDSESVPYQTVGSDTDSSGRSGATEALQNGATAYRDFPLWGDDSPTAVDGEDAPTLSSWEALPGRYKMVVASSAAFMICNMDKVNISVAIIPMAKAFGWSPTVAGLVQSSFFWGYMLSQIPGGYVNSRFGGRSILPLGVGLWSGATAAVPVLAGTIPGLCATRAMVGLGEGIAPSAATDMVARVIAKEERSRAVSFIFSGLHVGSLAGLLVAPPLIEHFGWETVFYIFGAAGLLWCIWWESVMAGIKEKEPEVAMRLISDPSVQLNADGSAGEPRITPWRAFFRNGPVRALAYTHFCNNWFHYTMLAWLPTYFTDTLDLNLTQAAQVALAPPIAALLASAVAGSAADGLVTAGWPVARVRKLAQCIAFLGPAACLVAAALLEDEWAAVALITASQGLSAFSLAGLYCNHADLSPKDASILLGITNTCGAIPGIIGVITCGWILDQTGSWPLALFVPSIVLFCSGAAVFTAFGSSELQDFENNNQPFAFESTLSDMRSMLTGEKQKDD